MSNTLFFVTVESNHQYPRVEGDASAEDVGELRGNHMCRLFLVDWHWNLQILTWGIGRVWPYQECSRISSCTRQSHNMDSRSHAWLGMDSKHQQKNIESACEHIQYHLIRLGRDPLTSESWNLTLAEKVMANSPIILWDDWIPRASSKVPVLRIFFLP